MRRAWSVVVIAAFVLAAPSAVGWTADFPRLPTVLHEGRSYVELDRVAAIIQI